MPEGREIKYSPEISHGEAAPETGSIETLPEITTSQPAAVIEEAPPVLPVKKIAQSPSVVEKPKRSSAMAEIITADKMFDNNPTIEAISQAEDMANSAREAHRQNIFGRKAA